MTIIYALMKGWYGRVIPRQEGWKPAKGLDAGILENKSPTLSHNSHYGSDDYATIRIII